MSPQPLPRIARPVSWREIIEKGGDAVMLSGRPLQALVGEVTRLEAANERLEAIARGHAKDAVAESVRAAKAEELMRAASSELKPLQDELRLARDVMRWAREQRKWYIIMPALAEAIDAYEGRR